MKSAKWGPLQRTVTGLHAIAGHSTPAARRARRGARARSNIAKPLPDRPNKMIWQGRPLPDHHLEVHLAGVILCRDLHLRGEKCGLTAFFCFFALFCSHLPLLNGGKTSGLAGVAPANGRQLKEIAGAA